MTQHKPIEKISSIFSYNITLDEHGYFEADVSRSNGSVAWVIATAKADELTKSGAIKDIRNPSDVLRYLQSQLILPGDAELMVTADAEKQWQAERTIEIDLPNFHGFYESVHDTNVDYAINQLFSDDAGDVHIPDDFWGKYGLTKEFMNEYCSEYTELLVEHMKQENDFLLPSMKFSSLYSPKEYNFSTDIITVTADAGELEKQITDWMARASDDDYIHARHYIAEKLRSRSGFASFFDDVVDRSGETYNVFEWFRGAIVDTKPAVIGVILGALQRNLDEQEILNAFTMPPFSETVENLVYKHLPKECKEMADAFNQEHYGDAAPQL